MLRAHLEMRLFVGSNYLHNLQVINSYILMCYQRQNQLPK